MPERFRHNHHSSVFTLLAATLTRTPLPDENLDAFALAGAVNGGADCVVRILV